MICRRLPPQRFSHPGVPHFYLGQTPVHPPSNSFSSPLWSLFFPAPPPSTAFPPYLSLKTFSPSAGSLERPLGGGPPPFPTSLSEKPGRHPPFPQAA